MPVELEPQLENNVPMELLLNPKYDISLTPLKCNGNRYDYLHCYTVYIGMEIASINR